MLFLNPSISIVDLFFPLTGSKILIVYVIYLITPLSPDSLDLSLFELTINFALEYLLHLHYSSYYKFFIILTIIIPIFLKSMNPSFLSVLVIKYIFYLIH